MRIGLISDTHVPYRAAKIPIEVLQALDGVDLILHAGDVDEPWVLNVLREIAPVQAVRGNYHLIDLSSGGAVLPEAVEVEAAGFRIAMTHGHKLGLATWFWKAVMLFQNLRGRWALSAYDYAVAQTLLRRFPDADIIVFGHTHRFYEAWWGQTLLVNPGAALRMAYFNAPHTPSLAYLYLEPGKLPRVERLEITIVSE